METYEQKRRRLFGKLQLPEYLGELSRLLMRDVQSTELLSIVETDLFLNSVSDLKNKDMAYEEIICFSDKSALLSILHRNISDWDVPYMMSLSHSLDCGMMQIPSLSCFNWDFEFDDECAGIISFTRADGKERFVLDYYEEDLEQYLEVRIKKA